ncbi:FemAB family XrtA/PEP-CTERM system-associated protein [Acidisphaera sp. S103]|uniref:FemAB family XrtA/PEP-CTERM system-associated protein n=1 Tax=Acidisphaera sp. S103 TaxID=1747223 RepID=UPI00131D902B|nr:FemAB family XrtA/PEP-CTERM system-associated protein [Acidisphaera sp. S103]
MVNVHPLDAASEAAWDRFVEAMPAGTFFHRAGWAKVIQAAFGHATHYCFTERDGSVTGVLPLARVKTLLFGDTLISNPFCVYGGPLAADAESEAALVAHAESLLARTGAAALEFRHLGSVQAADGWIERPDLYVTFRKPIEADHDRNMKAIPRKQRAMVRKGIQNGLLSTADRDVATLHRIYAESVRNLGTPVFSRRYFQILMDVFGDAADIVTIRDQAAPIASVMNFYFRDEVLPYYGGGSAAARGRAGNDFLYWETMRRAADRGARLFDFGRSKLGTGSFAFKHNWGFEPEKLHYRFRLKPGGSIPDHNPLNPKYRMFIAAWKRLPLPVANVLGPFIVRGVG